MWCMLPREGMGGFVPTPPYVCITFLTSLSSPSPPWQVFHVFAIGTPGNLALLTLEAASGTKWRSKHKHRFSEIRHLYDSIITVQSVLHLATPQASCAWWALRQKKPIETLSKVGVWGRYERGWEGAANCGECGEGMREAGRVQQTVGSVGKVGERMGGCSTLWGVWGRWERCWEGAAPSGECGEGGREAERVQHPHGSVRKVGERLRGCITFWGVWGR